jgi:hypothetical protein
VHTFTNGVTLKTAGSQSVTATDTVTSTITGSQTVTISAQTTGDTLTIVGSGNSQSATVGTAFSTALEVQDKDQYGNDVSGVTVTFTAPSSGASGTFANSTDTTTATTNASGDATASTFTANTKAGGYSVTTAASGVSSPPSFSETNTAQTTGDTLTIVGSGNNQSATVATAFTNALEVQDTDQYGNDVSGVTVTFTAPSSGASGAFGTCSVGNPQTYECEVTTNASGDATASTFTADDTAGSDYSVTTAASGVSSPPSFSETNTASTTNDHLTFVAQPPNGFAGVAMSQAVTVQVEDSYNNDVSESVPVALSMSSGTITSGGSATTSSSGLATFNALTIGTAAANLTLTANSSGLASATSNPFTVSVLVRYGNATLTDTATDAGSGVASVSYYYCSGFSGGCSPGAFIGTSTSGSGSSWSYTWSTGQPLDGSYQVIAVGTDNVDNTDVVPSTSIPVTVDNTAPTGSVTYTNGYQNTTSVAVTFSATDGVSGINASTGQLLRASASLSGGTCGTFGSYSQVGTTGLTSPYTDNSVASGNCYRYEYVVSDYAGNQTTVTSADTVEIDTAAPSATVTYPVTSTTYGTNWTGTITGTASDAIGTVSSTVVAVENNTTSMWWNGTSFTNGSLTYVSTSGTPTAWNLSLAASGNLVSGDSYSVVAQATDTAGNVGTSSTTTFTYNTSPPTVTVSYPVTSTTYGTNWTGAITGTANATATGATITSGDQVAVKNTTTGLWWGGSSFNQSSQTYVAVTSGTTSWSLTFGAGNLVSGDSYSVVAKATDSYGNVGTSSTTTFTYHLVTLVQEVNSPTTTSVSSLTVTLPNNVTAGDTLILSYASEADTNGAPQSVTDNNGGGAFIKEAHNVAATSYGSSQVWALFNAPGGATTVTISILSGPTYIQMADVTEWSGVVALDTGVVNDNEASSGTAVSAGQVTTNGPDLVISAAYAGTGNGSQPATPSGFNPLALAEGGSPAEYRGYGAYEMQISAGSIQATWSQPSSGYWSAAIAAFTT